jgi:hypothetical protein
MDDRRKRQIVVSLPAKHGEAMKSYLQTLADLDNRSLSNEVAWILKTWISENAPTGWDARDNGMEKDEQAGEIARARKLESHIEPKPNGAEPVEDLETRSERHSDPSTSEWS